MNDRRIPIGVAALALLLLLSTGAFAKKASITAEQYVRVTAEWQGGGDLDEVCARLGVDRQEYGEYMADLQIHDPAGYDELTALAMEGVALLEAGQPFTEDLLARIRAREITTKETVEAGRSRTGLLAAVCAVLILFVAVCAWLGLARMRQRTHQAYLAGLVEPLAGEVGTDADLLLAGRGGLWAGYTRLAAFAQLRGTFRGLKVAVTLEPESWTATNAGDMAMVRGGARRILVTASGDGDPPSAWSIHVTRQVDGDRGGERMGSEHAPVVSALEDQGFAAAPIPGGVLLVKSGFERSDLEPEAVAALLGKALQLCER
jgi:hypothetical protein